MAFRLVHVDCARGYSLKLGDTQSSECPSRSLPVLALLYLLISFESMLNTTSTGASVQEVGV